MQQRCRIKLTDILGPSLHCNKQAKNKKMASGTWNNLTRAEVFVNDDFIKIV